MVQERVETGVDDLIKYLQDKGKVGLKETAQAIKISEETLQLWVDFLVEERILGLEYKFTKPFIFLNKPKTSNSNSNKDDLVTIEFFKNEFVKNAKSKKIPDDKIEDLWHSHLSSSLLKLKPFFLLEAKKRNIKHSPEELFMMYNKKINPLVLSSKNDSSDSEKQIVSSDSNSLGSNGKEAVSPSLSNPEVSR